MTIENIIEDEEIFKGKHATYELVAGGFVNETYKVKCGSKTYCVRVNNKEQSRFFEFDAATEAQACQQASMFSIAPGVYNIDNSSEYLITDFFAGKFLSTDDSRNPEIVKKYVNAIKLIHNNIKVDRVFSVFDLIDKYIAGATYNNVKLPTGLNKILNEAEKLRKTRSDSKLLNNVFWLL